MPLPHVVVNFHVSRAPHGQLSDILGDRIRDAAAPNRFVGPHSSAAALGSRHQGASVVRKHAGVQRELSNKCVLADWKTRVRKSPIYWDLAEKGSL